MTNYEYLKNIGIEKLSNFLCEETEHETINSFPKDDCCEHCPVKARCFPGHNGWLSWLKEVKQ